MTQSENLLKRLPNDIGGLPAEPIQRVDHELEPWEKRCHALADVLYFHKIINTEEKRRGVEALGAEMVGKLSYYERWIAAFANILFRKVSSRLRISRGRWMRSPRDGRHTSLTTGHDHGQTAGPWASLWEITAAICAWGACAMAAEGLTSLPAYLARKRRWTGSKPGSNRPE